MTRIIALSLLCAAILLCTSGISVNAVRMISFSQSRTSTSDSGPTPTSSKAVTEVKSLFDPGIDWYTVVACCVSKDTKFTKSKFDGRELVKCGDHSVCQKIDPVMLKHIAHASTLSRKAKTRAQPTDTSLDTAGVEKILNDLKELIAKNAGGGGGKASIPATTINAKDLSSNRPQPIIPTKVGGAQAAGSAFVEHEAEVDVTTDEDAATSTDATTTKLAEVDSASISYPFSIGTSWPNGEVHYSWSDQITTLPNNIAGAIIFAFTDGMAEWASNTCVYFVQRPAGAGVVSLTIKRSLGSSSTSPRVGTGAQEVMIGVGIQMGSGRWPWSDDVMVGVQQRPDVVHEMGHVLGYEHAFTREDRASYVHIDTSMTTGCSLAKCTNTALADEYDVPCTKMTTILNDPTAFALYAQRQPKNPAALTSEEQVSLHMARLYALTHTPTPQQLMTQCKQALCHPRVENAYKRNVGVELYTRYDYSSVMHYHFDICMQAAPHPPYPIPPNMPGTNHISPLDIEGVCQIYHCGVKVVVNGAARAPGAGLGAATQTFTYSRFVDGSKTVADARAQLIDFLTADPLGRVVAAYTKADVLAQLALPWNADVAHPDLLNTQRLDAAPHGLTGAVGARTLTVYLLDAASCVHYNCIKVTISGKSQPKVHPPSSVTKGYPTPDSSYTMTAIIFRGAQTVADVRQAFIAAVATDPALAPVVLDSITHALRNGDIKHNGQALQPTQTLSAVGAFGGGHGPFTLALTTEFTIYSHRFVQAESDVDGSQTRT